VGLNTSPCHAHLTLLQHASSAALQLLIVSPLTRALDTATLAFGSHHSIPSLVEPLWRERLYLSSDVGRHPEELAAEFPHYGTFQHLPAIWWHTDAACDPYRVVEESEGDDQGGL